MVESALEFRPRREAISAGALDLSDRWLRLTVGLTALWGAAHGVSRILISSNLGRDDAKENIYTQTLQLGYDLRNPSLHDWLIWLLQQITGPNLASFLILKYVALVATAAFFYGAAKIVLKGDGRLAAMSTCALTLLYQVGWNHHIYMTHTVLLMLGMTATLYFALRVFETGQTVYYAALALAVGVGLLSKYSFVLFFVSLLVAALCHPRARARVLDWRMATTLVVALAFLAPVVIWAVRSGQENIYIVITFALGAARGGGNELAVRLDAAEILADASINFLMPFVAIIPLVYGFGLFRTRAVGGADGWARLVRDLMIAGVVIALAGTVFFGFDHIKQRYMHPLFLFVPIWVFAHVAAMGPAAARRLKWMAGVTVVVAVIGLVARVAMLIDGGPLLCGSICWEKKPYGQLADALRAAGLTGGTVIGARTYLSGNLRVHLPGTRVLDADKPRYHPPGNSAPCVVVWDAGPGGSIGTPPIVAREKKKGPVSALDVPWSHLWRPTGWRVSHFRAQRLDPASPACR